MQNGWKKLTAQLIAGLAVVMMMIGCSNDSPLSPDSNLTASNKGGGTNANLAAQVEFGSHVASVDVDLRKLTFTTNSEIAYAAPDAEIVRRNGGNETSISFSEIAVGDSVEIRGNRQGDNSILADRIRVKTEDNGAEVEFGGRVATINALARTMTFVGNPATINVMPNAEVVNHDLQIQIDLSEIIVGDSVDIRGTNQPDGSILADRVRLRKPDAFEDSDLEFKSRISAIDYSAGTFTVAGRSETISVDAATIIYAHLSEFEDGLSKRGRGGDDDGVGERDTLLSFTALKLGDSVEVHADIVDANNLRAVRIELEDVNGGIQDVQFKAAIATIDFATRTVTFVGQAWNGTVSQTAVLTGFNNEPITLESFPVGQLVEVEGFPGQSDALQIVRMHKEDNL